MGVDLPLTGSGDATATAATDTITGEEYPYAKLVSGAVGSTTPINTGEGVATNAMRTTIASDSAVIGAVNEAAPGTDTASSGLNGRLQRIAQRLTSILSQLSIGASALLKAEDAAHSSGDAGVMMLGVRGDALAIAPSGDYHPVLIDGSGCVYTRPTGGSLDEVTLVQTVTTVTTVGDATVRGFDNNGSAVSAAPVLGGHEARTTNPTAVDNGDAVNSMADDVGRQVVVLFGVRDLVSHQHTQIASSSSETTIVTAGGAGVFHDLLSLILTNQTATAVNVTIKDATAGTIRMVIALAASGGAVLTFPAPVNQASANGNWTATLSSAAVTVNIFAQFVKNV